MGVLRQYPRHTCWRQHDRPRTPASRPVQLQGGNTTERNRTRHHRSHLPRFFTDRQGSLHWIRPHHHRLHVQTPGRIECGHGGVGVGRDGRRRDTEDLRIATGHGLYRLPHARDRFHTDERCPSVNNVRLYRRLLISHLGERVAVPQEGEQAEGSLAVTFTGGSRGNTNGICFCRPIAGRRVLTRPTL